MVLLVLELQLFCFLLEAVFRQSIFCLPFPTNDDGYIGQMTGLLV